MERIRKLNQLRTYGTIRVHEAIARRAGLSPTDHKYLEFIIESGQMTAGELSQLTSLTTGAVTSLIDRFEKKNWWHVYLAKMTDKEFSLYPIRLI